MQIANRYRLDLLAFSTAIAGIERRPIERRLDPAVGAQPLAHAEPQPARDELLGRRQAQIVAVVLQPLAHFDHVAMAFGRQQADSRPLALQEHVGRDRGAVDDALGFGQQRCALATEPGSEQPQPIENPDRGIIRRRRELFECRPAIIVDRHEIGKGAADIDADAIHPRAPN